MVVELRRAGAEYEGLVRGSGAAMSDFSLHSGAEHKVTAITIHNMNSGKILSRESFESS